MGREKIFADFMYQPFPRALKDAILRLDLRVSALEEKLTAAPEDVESASKIGDLRSLQSNVGQFLSAAFGDEWQQNTKERAMRFFEEACELAQACGLGMSEMSTLLVHCLGREAGKQRDEIGDALITLCALSTACGWDAYSAGVEKFNELWQNGGPDAMRARHEAKADHLKAPTPVW